MSKKIEETGYDKMVRWPTFGKDGDLASENKELTDKTIPKNDESTTPPTETDQTIELTPKEIFAKLVFTAKILEKTESKEIIIPLRDLVHKLLKALQNNMKAWDIISQAYRDIKDDIIDRGIRGKELENKIMAFAQTIQETAKENEINLAKLLS